MTSSLLSSDLIVFDKNLYLKKLEADCCSIEDHMRILCARNDPSIRHSFFTSDVITLSSHLGWFSSYLENPYDHVYSIYHDNSYSGQVSIYNIDPESRSAELGRLFLLPNKRGQGIMSSIIQFIINDLKGSAQLSRIYLYCKPANQCAINLYKRVGFQVIGSVDIDGISLSSKCSSVKMQCQL
jgi:RimJ/RimL family protein N-acetyltransferase